MILPWLYFLKRKGIHMKIEMINEHQIRCTLTSEDLEERQIKLSELAYGSEKAKILFRDMMQQAADDFGFDAEDIPLMIEAIPLSAESIMLIISKVDSPDELDARFSNFTQDSPGDDRADARPDVSPFTDLSGLIAQIHNGKKSSANRNTGAAVRHPETDSGFGMFTFHDMDHAILLAHQLSGYYNAINTLYLDEKKDCFYLIMRQGTHNKNDFNRVLHTAAKYLHQEKYAPAKEAYCQEHYRLVFKDNALQKLAEI